MKRKHSLTSLRVAAIAIFAALVSTADAADPEALAESKQCFDCHSLDKERQAPSFGLIARNYGGIPNADYMLERRVRLGSVGHWGLQPMPAAGSRPDVSETEAKEIVAWILSRR